MKTVLTGFGPFGAVVNNPSARIVEHFARSGATGHDLTTRVLPVSYARAADEVHALLAAGPFDAALLLGVAARDPVLRLEQFGCWRPCDQVDCDGQVPAPDDRCAGSSEPYAATVELQPLLQTLIAAGLPARLSDDAGDYVCNHTYYHALHTIAAQRLPTRCLFLHVPADPDCFAEPSDGPLMPLADQITAVERVLDWLARSGQ